MIFGVTTGLCATLCGRRPASPAGRPRAENLCDAEKGGGSWGNHGFPHVG
jgi:hypothetical protein